MRSCCLATLRHYLSYKHSKINKLQVNDYVLCCNDMLLIGKWKYLNPYIVQVIDSLSYLSDRKDRNKWVISNSQDVIISTQDDDEPSRLIHKAQRALGTAWTELLHKDGPSMVPGLTKSGVTIISSNNDQLISHKVLKLVKSGYHIQWIFTISIFYWLWFEGNLTSLISLMLTRSVHLSKLMVAHSYFLILPVRTLHKKGECSAHIAEYFYFKN